MQMEQYCSFLYNFSYILLALNVRQHTAARCHYIYVQHITENISPTVCKGHITSLSANPAK